MPDQLQAGWPDTAAPTLTQPPVAESPPTRRERREQHQGARSAPERSTRASVGPKRGLFPKLKPLDQGERRNSPARSFPKIQSRAMTVLRMGIRVDALILIVLGILFWTGNAVAL